MAMNRDELAVFLEWASRSEAVLENIGTRGARYDHNLVRGFQAWYNQRLSPIQAALVSGGISPDAVASMIPLTEDGLWGPNTAAVASIPLRPEIPVSGAPRRAADVPAWWSAQRDIVARKVTQLENQLSALDLRLSEQNSATVVPGGTPTEVLPNAELPTGAGEGANAADEATVLFDPETGEPFRVRGRVVKDTPPVPKSTSWMAAFLVAGVLGVGGFLFYRIIKSRRGQRKPARLKASTA